MVDHAAHSGAGAAAVGGAAMRIFIFKSDANTGLGAFSGDPVGLELPSQFKPWHAVGAIAPDRDPPYKLSRSVIEAAIKASGFQLFRLKGKD
jgi:hypothetical protein